MAVLRTQRFSGSHSRKSIENKVSDLSSITNGNKHNEIHMVMTRVLAEHEVYYQKSCDTLNVTGNSISPWVMAMCGYSTVE